MLRMSLAFILLFLHLLLYVYFFYTIVAILKGGAFVPTSRRNVKRILALAKPKSGESLIDLGSGDGRILIEAAKDGAKCVGVEINPLLCWYSRFRIWLKGLKNVTVTQTDLWKTDLSQFDILTVYFVASKMGALGEKIKKEMKPGSRVVSSRNTFPDWECAGTDDKVYLYIV